MTESENSKPDTDKHVHGYNRMLERVKEFIVNAEEDLASKFSYAVDQAKQKASELGELTREESEEIADYIKRDIHDAADYLAEEGTEMGDWLRFDVQLVEAKLLEWMSMAVDTTKLELDELAQQAAQENIRLAGEITGPGTLTCTNCDHEIAFTQTEEIPPCPKCDNKEFHRKPPQM